MNTIVEQVNSAGTWFVDFAWPMLMQSSVLIAVLLLADFLLRRKVRAVVRYWVWMLVFIKLILPTTLWSPVGVGNFLGDRITVTAPGPAPAQRPADEPQYVPQRYAVAPDVPVATASVADDSKSIAIEPAPQTITLTWQAVVFLVWLAAIVAMALLLVQRVVFVCGLVRQAVSANGLMADTLRFCCKRMGIGGYVGLKVSANATSPAVCGLVRPVILVPANLGSTLGADHLRTVLLHELAHIKRGDLWVNLAQTLLQIAYFYNPLLWLANWIIRRVREQAVDEMVQVALGEKAGQYPETLLGVAKLAFERPALSLRLVGVVESKSALSGRIKRMLTRPIPKTAKLGILALFAIVLVGIVLLPMAKAAKTEKVADYVSATVTEGVGFADIVVGDSNCTGEFIKAKLGQPDEETKADPDWWLDYRKQCGIDFWVDLRTGIMGEIRLNPGFKGKLTSGISLFSTKENVFRVYGEPMETRPSSDLSLDGSHFESRVLFFAEGADLNGVSKMYYMDRGVLFWFKGDKVNQIVVSRPCGDKRTGESKFAATLSNGVTVELVGLCEDSTEGKQWWRPDGTVSEKAVFLEGPAGGVKKGNAVGFIVRTSASCDVTWREIERANDQSQFVTIRDANDQPIQDAVLYHGRIAWFGEADETSIKLEVAPREWIVAASYDGKYVAGWSDPRIKFLETYQTGDGVKLVFDQSYPRDYDLKVEARLRKGDLRSIIPGEIGDIWLPNGEKNKVALFDDVNLSDITSFQCTVRKSLGIVEFKNVSLKPGAKTDTKVVVNSDSVAAGNLPSGDAMPLEQKLQKRISVDFRGTPIEDVVRILSEKIGVSFIKSPEVRGNVTAKAGPAPAEEILRNILVAHGWGYMKDKNIVTVVMQQALPASQVEQPQESSQGGKVSIEGRVFDWEGKAVAEAQVALCTENKGVIVKKGRLEPTNSTNLTSEIVETDRDGRFVLSERPEEYEIVVAHQDGFARATPEDVERSSDVVLDRWGRIEGEVRIGKEAGAQKRVSLLNYINNTRPQQNIRYEYDTDTDANGRFVFAKVPPGWVEAGYHLEISTGTWTHTCRTRYEVRPGETTMAKIGGTGRDVTGRFVVPKAYNERVDFDYGVHAFYTPRPAPPYPAGLAEDEQQQWYSKWRTSEDGRRFWESTWHNANVRHYAFRIEKDGTFRIKDVVPGEYEFWMSVEEPATGVVQTSEIASYREKVAIPGAPNVYINEAFDLGELLLKMTPPSPAG